jgi:hypothetical protein
MIFASDESDSLPPMPEPPVCPKCGGDIVNDDHTIVLAPYGSFAPIELKCKKEEKKK